MLDVAASHHDDVIFFNGRWLLAEWSQEGAVGIGGLMTPKCQVFRDRRRQTIFAQRQDVGHGQCGQIKPPAKHVARVSIPGFPAFHLGVADTVFPPPISGLGRSGLAMSPI